MSNFNLATELNKLGYKRKTKWNTIKEKSLKDIPIWAMTEDFFNEFLPYLTIYGDSREQNDWVGRACEYYGINFIPLKKDKKLGTENLKEGDYSFAITFDDTFFDYANIVTYERKGSLNELYNNCTRDRERLEREFERCIDKGYKKVVLLLEYGERVQDLIYANFSYRCGRQVIKKDTGLAVYSTLMSWRQSNRFNIDIYQSENKITLFWLMLQDMFYFFRNEIRNKGGDNNVKRDKESEG